MPSQTRGLAALLAAQGRYGDDELIHVNKREIAALERLGRRHGIETTTNPRTGLKEAFNWLSTLGGIAGGVAGSFIAPGAGTAAGAALGSGLGTKAGGGSTEEALTNGMISGVTAWAGAGLADSLSQAGAEAGKEAAGEVVKTGVQEGVQTGVQGGLQNTATQNLSTAITQAPQNTGLGSTLFNAQAPVGGGVTPQASSVVGEGMTPQAGKVVGDTFVQNPVAEVPKMSLPGSSGQIPMAERASDYWGNVGKGIQSLNTPNKIGDFAIANKGSLIGTGMGLAGVATAPSGSSSDASSTDGGSTSPNYRGEVYYTPYGERRTRAVPYAGGGEVWGDYDGVEDEHAGGGLMGYASGGIAQRFDRGGASELDVSDLEHPAARYLRRAEAGGSPIVDKNVRGAAGRVGYNFPVGDTGNFNAGVSGYGMRAHAPGTDPVTRGRLTGVDLAYSPSQDRTISARYDAMAPASMPSYGGGYSAADFGGRPSEAQMMSMGPAPMARDRFSVNYRQSFAEGGISSLGSYSDGGQLLRGPGDGVSDNIPASIEGKRPARLAEGEFVVPARAVSELGNGSTEAGSKQLYAMLDRIAKKRKKGSGLAYQANPKKLMPV